MKARGFASPAAFHQALDQRLRNLVGGGSSLARVRQILVFDRFMARVAAEFEKSVILKGGLVMELRVAKARTTQDIDLRISGAADQILARLQNAANRDSGDFFTFKVERDLKHPTIQVAGMPYDCQRFRAEGRIGGRLYGAPFGVDVGIGDPLVGEIETVSAPDLLGFAGIAPPQLRLYPLESHVAEKLHAYTLPRPRPNSRVKDLPDIALLASARAVDGALLREALAATFAARQSHPLPKMLPEPPSSWELPYAAMATTDELPWPTLAAVTAAARTFLDPPLLGHGGRWEPQPWRWV